VSDAKKKDDKKKGKGLKLPKISLPKFKPPQIRLPSKKGQPPRPPINIPAPDGTFLMAMVLVGGLSAASAAIAIHFAMPRQVIVQRPTSDEQEHGKSYNPQGFPDLSVGPNVTSDYSMSMERPVIADTAYVNPHACIIGYASVGDRSYVAPQASIRADVGKNIAIGNESAVLDGAVIHALPTEEKGVHKMENIIMVDGQEFAVHVGNRVTLAPQCQVYGPAAIGDNCYVGMQALVFKSRIGDNCVLEPRSAAIGVSIGDSHYIPAGIVVTSQQQADALPTIGKDYAYKDANDLAVKVNTQLVEGYLGLHPTGN
jgi:carbonic anhydrase/acetyltransferase-like protein (isoleucine patch superfamily)